MNILKKGYKKLVNLLRLYDLIRNKDNLEQMMQVVMMNQYKIMTSTPPFNIHSIDFFDVGFRAYSQFDEDGILLYIFSLIGFTNRKVVEICAGTGEECNTANLIINHSCYGLLFDGDKKNIEHARKFFSEHRSTEFFPPVCKQAWITKDNINQLISENGFSGTVDLLSLDIDGNDYWIWDAVDIIKPRVFICEAHNICPDNEAITIPYKDEFNYKSEANYHEEFRSASPLAMITLSKRKGYRLVGCHKYGFNLIFIYGDIGKAYLPEVSLDKISDNPYTIESKKVRWPSVKDAPWVHV
jgi:hypothetical protein